MLQNALTILSPIAEPSHIDILLALVESILIFELSFYKSTFVDDILIFEPKLPYSRE